VTISQQQIYGLSKSVSQSTDLYWHLFFSPSSFVTGNTVCLNYKDQPGETLP